MTKLVGILAKTQSKEALATARRTYRVITDSGLTPVPEAAGRQTPQPNESRSLDHSGRRRHSIEGNSRDAESSDPDTSGKPRQKRISNRNRTRRSRKIIHQMAQARFSDGGTMVRFCHSE